MISPDGLNYRLEGQGPLLVLLHELGGSLESWDETAAELAGDFTILRYDQRGAGASDRPHRLLPLDDHIADLEHLLAELQLPLPCWLAAVAAGAALAVAFAVHRPQAVAGLVLCAPALSVDPARRDYLMARADLAAREGMAAIAEATLANSYPPAIRRQPEAFARYRQSFLANDPICYGNANRMLAQTDLEALLPPLAAPCLVLSGRHDGMRPPQDGRALAARIPGAAFDILDSGHLMPVQAGLALAGRLRDHIKQQPE